jgi:hypothetical protein
MQHWWKKNGTFSKAFIIDLFKASRFKSFWVVTPFLWTQHLHLQDQVFQEQLEHQHDLMTR